MPEPSWLEFNVSNVSLEGHTRLQDIALVALTSQLPDYTDISASQYKSRKLGNTLDMDLGP